MRIVNRLLRSTAFLILASCAYNDLSDDFDCASSDLAVTLNIKTDASSCKSIDGKIMVTATGGEGIYDFNINGGEYQTSNEFDKLAPGTYTVIVKDVNKCKASILIEVGAVDSNLSATSSVTEDNQCSSDNGSVTVVANGGTSPYVFKIDGGIFGTDNIFINQKNGQHSVIVKDFNDCQRTLSVVIPRGSTGVSYANNITPIFVANCTLENCHDSGTGSRDWTNFSNVKREATSIKVRTANRSMPIGGKTLTKEQIDLIGCWVDDGANDN